MLNWNQKPANKFKFHLTTGKVDTDKQCYQKNVEITFKCSKCGQKNTGKVYVMGNRTSKFNIKLEAFCGDSKCNALNTASKKGDFI